MAKNKVKARAELLVKKYEPGLRIIGKPEGGTIEQEEYIKSLDRNTFTAVLGPSGSGKTMIAVQYAAWMLSQGLIKKILITRPCQESLKDSVGFLPGTLFEKMYEYIYSMLGYLQDIYSKEEVDAMLSSGVIEPVTIGLIRGRTYHDTCVIIDEAQNTTPAQLRLLLTRVGHRSKVIACGDIRQKDINHLMSGLEDSANKLAGIPGVGIIKLSNISILRSNFVKAIEERYQEYDEPLRDARKVNIETIKPPSSTGFENFGK